MFFFMELIIIILLSPCPQKHVSECQKIPIDCSNGCGQITAREEVKLEDSKIDWLFLFFLIT